MISMGLANTAMKQMILSGVARDSTTAFYQADVGSECALYADDSDTLRTLGGGNQYNCANQISTTTKTINGAVTTYTLTPSGVTGGCYYATITKTNVGDAVETRVESRGYNICDMTNIRTVERAILVTY
jgi:hypothetical protein